MKILGSETVIVVPYHNSGQIQKFCAQWGVEDMDKDTLTLFYHDSGGMGCAKAKNSAIKHAIENCGAEIVVILDDDCYPVPGSGMNLAKFAEAHVKNLINPCPVEMFAKITNPRSRGTPRFTCTKNYPPAASIGFWRGSGDFCAVDDLASIKGSMLGFTMNSIFGQYFALSGMNIAFCPKDWLPWCQFIDVPRYDDVWMGLLFQKEAYRRGFCFSFNGPEVFHDKQSNKFANLRHETQWFEENETLWLKILESKETDYATLRALLPPC